MRNATESRVELDKRAYEYLKRKIILGEVQPGESLVETDISKELNMSRTPVRAALKMLESENLVKLFPAKGAFVANLTIQDIEELFEYRILLETEALKSFIKNASDALIDTYLDAFKRYSDMDEFKEDYHAMDSQFHLDIMKFIHNSKILSTYFQLQDLIDWSRHIAALDQSRVRSTPGEHIEVLNYMKARDLEKANEALVKHLKSVEASVLSSYRNVYYERR